MLYQVRRGARKMEESLALDEQFDKFDLISGQKIVWHCYRFMRTCQFQLNCMLVYK